MGYVLVNPNLKNSNFKSSSNKKSNAAKEIWSEFSKNIKGDVSYEDFLPWLNECLFHQKYEHILDNHQELLALQTIKYHNL